MPRPPALTFDETAEIYERSRPGWPSAALDHVARELELDRGAPVLDLGAGTGKLTRLLVARFDRVVAVEPLDGMRVPLESLVPQAESLPGEAASYEPLPKGTYTWRIRWLGTRSAHVELTVRW